MDYGDGFVGAGVCDKDGGELVVEMVGGGGVGDGDEGVRCSCIYLVSLIWMVDQVNRTIAVERTLVTALRVRLSQRRALCDSMF